MSGFQFIHLTAYSSKRPLLRGKNGKPAGSNTRKFSASDILDEADREPGATKHITNPQKPNWLIGSRDLIEFAGAKWMIKKPDDARTDSSWLAAGVISLPTERAKDWDNYRDQAIEWLKKKYGKTLVGVVEHLDEEHPHLHFYCVAAPGQSFGTVHEGWAAKTAARKSGRRDTGVAFNTAMKKFQDEFSEFAIQFGLTRFGPKRSRMTRDEWQLEQEKAKATELLIQAQQQANQIIESAKNKADKIIKAVEQESAEIRGAARAERKKIRSELREQIKRLEDWEKDVAGKADQIKEYEKVLNSNETHHAIKNINERIHLAKQAQKSGEYKDAQEHIAIAEKFQQRIESKSEMR